jgi:adenosylcobinamide-GDP ribazoletransferase
MGIDLPEFKDTGGRITAWARCALERVRRPIADGRAKAALVYHVSPWIDDVRVAVSLLTRLPMPHPHGAVPDNLSRAQRAFPLVGAMIGVAVGLVYGLLAAIGVPGLAAAVLALGASAVLTGALHEDGLGDVADGFGGGHDRESKLAIMRDSRLGTYGALAVVIAFAAKAAALEAMAPATAFLALAAAHALGRAVIPVLAATMPPARTDGLGHGAGRPASAHVMAALVVAAAVALLCLPFGRAVVAMSLAGIGAAGVAVLARRQIGGITGDVFGAAEQVVEIAVLMVAASG